MGSLNNQTTETCSVGNALPPNKSSELCKILRLNNIDVEVLFDHQNHFPSFLLTNLQSFGNPGPTDKISELCEVLRLNSIDVGVFTETWATDVTLKRLEAEVDGYTMFHSTRENCLRSSGGVSIFVKTHFPANKIDIVVPNHLEILYVSIRPKKLPRTVSNIVLCGVYFPGTSSLYAPSQEDILLHLTEAIQSFYDKFANPLIILLGDFNDLKTNDLSETCLLKQVVNVPTRKSATLDLIMTNIDNHMYEEPTSIPSIAKSDHLCVLYVPKKYIKQEAKKEKIWIRKFKKSALIEFGSWISNFDWTTLFEIKDVNDKVEYFTTVTWLMVEKLFPLQKIIFSSSDKEWMTPKIKGMIAQRQKAHKAENFELRNYLAKKIRIEIRNAKIKFNDKRAHLFHMSNPREWYKHINKIIGNKKHRLNLTNIPELAYKTVDEQVAIVNNHFGNICKKYPPLDKNFKVSENELDESLKKVMEVDTYKMLRKYSKKSLGPNDLPQKLLQEFAPELATPFCDIINCALRSGIFPDAYKKAEIVPIPKVNPPRSLSDLRPISKTPIGGKMIEKALMSELEKDIKGKLDNTQYGNCRGASTTHYLIKLTDQAFKSTDKGHATSIVTIDYSKAFDYVDHGVLIQRLVQLGVRGKIINLLISFLSDRSHNTNFLGKKSEFFSITCGVPQGTVTGPKLFVILINGDKCNLVVNYKFVDDKTLALSYSGDPTKILQEALDIELNETIKDKMIINESKCHLMNFNFSKNNFPPQNLKFNGKPINVAKKIKLLGVMLTDDLKWAENTVNICSKVNKKLYQIRMMKQFGLQRAELVTAWRSMLRPVAEYAVPLWHSGLTESDSGKIEMLQKKALGTILGTVYVDNKRYYKLENEHVTYLDALQNIGLTTLKNRREVLTSKFALETARNESQNDMFLKKQNNYITTRNRLILEEPHCKTDRYYKSTIPYITRILNGVEISKKESGIKSHNH